MLLLLFLITTANASTPVTSLLEMRQRNVTIQEWGLMKREEYSADLQRFQMKNLVAKAPLNVPIMTNAYSHFVIFRSMSGNRIMLIEKFKGKLDRFPRSGAYRVCGGTARWRVAHRRPQPHRK